MKYFIFKSPRKKGDTPLEVLNYEPQEFIIEAKAMKYGSVEVVSEEKLANEN